MSSRRSLRGALALGGLWCCMVTPAHGQLFKADGLVSDDVTLHPAQVQDAGLVNAWGLSYSATGPFWVSAADGNVSPIYRVNPATQATTKAALTVSVPGNPTGQVFNGNASAFNGDNFLFVGEDGSVHGWRGALGSTAEVLVTGSADNSYKGAAYATIGSDSYLYATNFATGRIDVFKGMSGSPDLAGSFTDPGVPSGYAPFNVQRLGSSLYVTYVKQDDAHEDEVKGAGLGLVDQFDLQGNFMGRVTTGGTLNAPWGLALAPDSFGAWAGALLVGNFGDGRINAFDASTHSFLGQVLGSSGSPLEIDGLWAISPGNDGQAGSSHSLYFTAGPDDESHGLFGVLTSVPEPSTLAMLVLGLVAVAVVARRRG